MLRIKKLKIEERLKNICNQKILKAFYSKIMFMKVAYEIYQLKNKHQNIGLGRVGEFEKPISETEFLQLVKMQCDGIRHSKFLGKSKK